jgi:ubiquinone/menaquinone biosynthesis C-methylase UbiE
VTDPKEIIRAGYDAIAERYARWRDGIKGSPEEDWLDDLAARLPASADVLELGCGQGVTAHLFANARNHYVGVDISGEQVRRAQALAPEAEFRRADLAEIEFDNESFDAVTSFYVFNHVPRAELPAVLKRIGRWLRPGGYLLASFGRSGNEGIQEDWLGVPMFFASYTEPETLELVRAGGLEVERHEVGPIVEPEGEARFLWILARKPPSRAGGSRSGRE